MFTQTIEQPVQARQVSKSAGCTNCRDAAPFGCEDCRKEIEQDSQPKIFIGSGEDMPIWSFA